MDTKAIANLDVNSNPSDSFKYIHPTPSFRSFLPPKSLLLRLGVLFFLMVLIGSVQAVGMFPWFNSVKQINVTSNVSSFNEIVFATIGFEHNDSISSCAQKTVMTLNMSGT